MMTVSRANKDLKPTFRTMPINSVIPEIKKCFNFNSQAKEVLDTLRGLSNEILDADYTQWML
jgi:hypothetical protein